MASNDLIYIFQHGHGLITFTSVLTVVILDQWKIKFEPKYLLQAMLYSDALAFCFFYAGVGLGNTLSPCSQTYLGFISDLVWAAKDGFKNAYLVWKVLKVVSKFSKNLQLLMYSATGIVSFFLYILYMTQAYVLTGTCQGNGTVSITWTLILLYLYWFAVDFSVSVVFLWFLSSHVASSRLLSGRPSTATAAGTKGTPTALSRVLRRETFRVAFSTGLGFIVCILVVIQFITGLTIVYINGIIFTMAQHILILSTVNNKFSDEDSSATSSQGQTQTGTHKV
ncbi:uncharacterized protein BJ171DRAFT_584274 [Polychytrium aggregatum]|uniref:uncharacterized protein n=1 Tax=Polychytrium aggregatum TaxID=110093 RepID=UPI0022FEA292|nr:uncharacterized protein BJ171DRAFT_584274 [Polychytrium aggregatum]KAI9202368.1 hypothetical protein BJ171DRAFT_584274 [Polychytrium aggregatum]